MMTCNQPEALDTGKSAPDNNHRGMRNKLMMAWKAWVESMGQAMANPNAVREKETRKTVNTTSRNPIKVMCTPSNGANARKSSPWMVESVVPPSTLPSTMAARGTGATRTESRKPSLRSSITDIMVKIEVKSTNIMSALG